MKISLLYNGKYKIFENDDSIDFIISNTQYLILDNSTSLKGKTYTLIDLSKINYAKFKRSIANTSLKMELYYDSIDVPIDKSMTIQSEIPFNSMEKIFSIYPLIKQIFGFGYFKELYLDADYINLYINSI